MHVTIKGHRTTTDSVNLCTKCQHAQCVSGRSISEQTVFCAVMDRFVPFLVTECNKYLGIGTLSRHEMDRIAWRIALDKRTKKIGFYSPKQLGRDDGRLVEEGSNNDDY